MKVRNARLKSGLSKGILSILGLGATCFIFEACYGVPKVNDFNRNYQISGKLSSESSQNLDNLHVTTVSRTGNFSSDVSSDGSFQLILPGSVGDQVSLAVSNQNEITEKDTMFTLTETTQISQINLSVK